MKLQLFHSSCRFLTRAVFGITAAVALVGASAQTVTGTFAPSTVAPSTNATLTLGYSGFTSDSTGMNLRVYFNSAAVTLGTVTYGNPPGQSQPFTAATAGTLASCAGANQFITLNWVDFGGTWPTPNSGSNLATISFTTAAGFTGTEVCWEDDITNGAPERNIVGEAPLNLTVTPSTAVFTISTPVNVTEAGGTANATVTCTGAFASNQTLPVSLAFTTSNAAGNFTTTASPSSFAACGGATQTITVTPRADDATVQGAVVGGIALTAPAAGVGTLGAVSSAVVNVADNDTPAVVTIAVAPASATEAGGVLTYTITRAGGNQTVALPVTITPPAASGRYSTTCTSPVNIPANQATASCTVTGLDNAATDGSVTATVTVTAGSNYTVGSPATATGTITDDDGPPSISVAVSGSPASENGGVLTYTFTRTGNAGQIAAALTGINITAPAATARFSTTCGSTISFLAAATTATCTYTGIDNAALDGNVSVVVTVASGSGYTVGSPATATGTITDNEIGVSVAATAASITEGGLASFTLSCTGSGTFSVNYTVNTVGSDGAVTPASPANLTCGTPLNVTVQTAQDTVPANGRSLTLTINSVGAGAAIVPGQGAATVVVQDDDGPPPTIPTMGVFGLALLGLLMAGIGGIVQRRRK